MSQEIKLVAIFDLKVDSWPKVASAVHHCVYQTRKEIGNHCYKAHFEQSHKDRLVFVECWENEEAIQKHMQTEHFQNLIKAFEPYLEKPMEILTLTEIQEKDV